MRLRQTDLTWQELDGHVVVLDLRASAYLEINGSGSLLFPLLLRGTTEEEMVAALTQEFDLAPQTAGDDVAAFVRMIRAQDLLEG